MHGINGYEYRRIAKRGRCDAAYRCLRMTIQLMRQTASRLGPTDPLRARLRRAIDRINRDEVDAERQLRMAVDDP